MAQKIAQISGVKLESIYQKPSEEICANCNDYQAFIDDIKTKMSISNRISKIQLLTLAPKSWSNEKIASEFNVTMWMVKKAKKAVLKGGILSTGICMCKVLNNV